MERERVVVRVVFLEGGMAHLWMCVSGGVKKSFIFAKDNIPPIYTYHSACV